MLIGWFALPSHRLLDAGRKPPTVSSHLPRGWGWSLSCGEQGPYPLAVQRLSSAPEPNKRRPVEASSLHRIFVVLGVIPPYATSRLKLPGRDSRVLALARAR